MKRFLLLSLLLASSVCFAALAQARSDYKIAPHDIIVIDVFYCLS